MLPQLPELGLLDQFQSASLLKENLFKTLVDLLTNLGKKTFRPYVEYYLDATFRTAKGKHIYLIILDHKYNCQYPAQTFLMELNKTYGEGILRAIVESHDSRYL